MFPTDEYAEYVFFLGVYQLVMPVTALRMNFVTLIRKNAKSGRFTLSVANALTFLVTPILVISVYLLYTVSDKAAVFSNLPLTIIVILVLAISNNVNFYVLKTKAYKKSSIGKVIETLVDKVGAVIFSTMWLTSTILLLCRLLGSLFKLWFYNLSIRLTFNVNMKLIKATMRRYRRFIYYAPSILLNKVAVTIPIFLIGLYYQTIDAVFYGLMMQIIQTPFGYIGDSVNTIAIQNFAEQRSKETDRLHPIDLVLWMMVLTFGAVLAGFFAGKDVLALVVTKSWADEGNQFGFALICFYAFFLLRPMLGLLDAYELQWPKFIVELALAIATAVSFFLGQYLNPSSTIDYYTLQAISYLLITLGTFVYIVKLTKYNLLQKLMKHWRVPLIMVLSFTLTLFFRQLKSSSQMNWLIMLPMLLYYVYLAYDNKDFLTQRLDKKRL